MKNSPMLLTATLLTDVAEPASKRGLHSPVDDRQNAGTKLCW